MLLGSCAPVSLGDEILALECQQCAPEANPRQGVGARVGPWYNHKSFPPASQPFFASNLYMLSVWYFNIIAMISNKYIFQNHYQLWLGSFLGRDAPVLWVDRQFGRHHNWLYGRIGVEGVSCWPLVLLQIWAISVLEDFHHQHLGHSGPESMEGVTAQVFGKARGLSPGAASRTLSIRPTWSLKWKESLENKTSLPEKDSTKRELTLCNLRCKYFIRRIVKIGSWWSRRARNARLSISVNTNSFYAGNLYPIMWQIRGSQASRIDKGKAITVLGIGFVKIIYQSQLHKWL